MSDKTVVQPLDDQDKSGGRPVGVTSETFHPYIVNKTGGDLVLIFPAGPPWSNNWEKIPDSLIADGQTSDFVSTGSLTNECSGEVIYTASALNNARFTLVWHVNPYLPNQISPSVDPGLNCVVGGSYRGWSPDPSFTLSPS